MKARELRDTTNREEKHGVKQEMQVIQTVSTPEKRKTEAAVIDLTGDEERSVKRNRLNDALPSSPLLRFAKDTDRERIVGEVPARLNRFPALTLGEMITRMEWIGDTKNGASTKSRFSRVFSCSYGRTAYYNHRAAWIHLKETGALERYTGEELWMPIYSSSSGKANGNSGSRDDDDIDDIEEIEDFTESDHRYFERPSIEF